VAWEGVRANHGAPGVDGVTRDQMGASQESVPRFLDEIQKRAA
jgi:hypothetical protein